MAVSGVRWACEQMNSKFPERMAGKFSLFRGCCSPKTVHLIDGVAATLLFVMSTSCLVLGGKGGFFRFSGKVLLLGSVGEVVGLSVIYRKNLGEASSWIFSSLFSKKPAYVNQVYELPIGDTQEMTVRDDTMVKPAELASEPVAHIYRCRTEQQINREYELTKEELESELAKNGDLDMSKSTLDDVSNNAKIEGLLRKMNTLSEEAEAAMCSNTAETIRVEYRKLRGQASCMNTSLMNSGFYQL